MLWLSAILCIQDHVSVGTYAIGRYFKQTIPNDQLLKVGENTVGGINLIGIYWLTAHTGIR